MRIALLCCDRGVPLGGLKGCSIHLRAVAEAWLRAGHEVVAIVAETGPLAGVDRLAGMGLEVRPLRQPAGTRELDWQFGQVRPDFIYERLALLAPHGARAAADAGLPHVYEVNAPLDQEASRHRGFERSDEARASFTEGFQHSSGSVCVSEPVADWVRALAPASHAVHVEPNGASHRFLEAPDEEAVERLARRFGLEAGEFRVGFVGSFRPWHDLSSLVEAVARLQKEVPARLVLIGDGPARNTVLEHATRERVGVTLCGLVPHDEVPIHLALCDAVVVPYANEGDYFSPLKLIESMAAGRAIVASATVPVRAFLRHGEDALLAEPGDVLGLTWWLRACAMDQELRERLGAEARRRVAARFTWDSVAERIRSFATSLPAIREGSCGS